MECHWSRLFIVMGLLAGLAPARGETVVALPAGAGEHFTVETSTGQPLLRSTTAATLTGTNVALGTLGAELPVAVSTQTVARFLADPIQGSLIVGSNRVVNPQANLIAGHTNYVYLSPYSSILGGSESIRDFIAFPKNNSGRDVMLDAPASIDQKQLDELAISLK